MPNIHNTYVISCIVIRSTGLYDTKMVVSSICTWQLFIMEKCSIFSTTTREENYYSCKEIDHPTVLECDIGDRVHRFKQQQKTAFLLFR